MSQVGRDRRWPHPTMLAAGVVLTLLTPSARSQEATPDEGTALRQRIEALERRAVTTDKALAWLAAAAALREGRPLGSLPDAPPALARFADQAPPTEAGLRLAYPEAARAAQAASHPPTQGLSVGRRMWLRAQSILTVRQDDRVLLGTPAAGFLEVARGRLNAGDLAGARAELDRLDPAAAAAMAGWLADARAVVEARAALAAAR